LAFPGDQRWADGFFATVSADTKSMTDGVGRNLAKVVGHDGHD
jgi:hypothetical protein